jgi:methanogenic corrinoid protein MtbC1
MDEDRFEKFLSANILRSGFERTFLDIIHPFMIKVGVLWLTNSINPAQEHFISNLVRQKLIAAIDGIAYSSGQLKDTCLLFLPENELHEISLLFANYILKKNGFKTIYLGQSVPYNDIKMVTNLHLPKNLITVITCSLTDISIDDYLTRLSNEFNKQNIFVAGYQINNSTTKLPSKVKAFNTPQELLQLVSK